MHTSEADMRSAVLLAVVAIGLPLLVASCEGTSEPQTSGTMAAMIDGTPWQGDLTPGTGVYNTTAENLGGRLR
jgi:hypothetical protein